MVNVSLFMRARTIFFSDFDNLVYDTDLRKSINFHCEYSKTWNIKTSFFQLREIASDKLEKNELVQLLSWVNAYGYFFSMLSCYWMLFRFIRCELCSGEQILGNPRLQINTTALLADHPLLPKSTITQLCDRLHLFLF